MKERWEDYKKIYRSIQVPRESVDTQWETLLPRLPEQQKHPYAYYVRYGALFTGIVLLLSIGIVGASQKAQPGEALYSIKQLTNDLGINNATKPETKIEKKQAPLIKKPTPTITPTSIPQPTAASSVRIEQDVQGAHIENIQQENSQSPSNNTVNKQENNNASNANINGNDPHNQHQGNQGKSDESHGNSDNAHSNGNGNSGNSSDKGNGKNK